MSKKALIFGLFLALLASSVGGAFTASNANADYIPPYGTLVCSPSVQTVNSGDLVSFSAYFQGLGGNSASYAWQAVGGNPSSGSGQWFSTRFYTSSINETRLVTVTSGYQTATCAVYVNGATPTPTVIPSTLSCSAYPLNVSNGEQVTFTAWGGNGIYSWAVPNGTPSSGNGQQFLTRFYIGGSYSSLQTASVYSGNQWASCSVTVNGDYVTPTPTPYYGYISVDHAVRNVTRGGEGLSVTAYNGDRLQFTIKLTTGNNQYAYNVYVRDWLPQYVGYVSGTTTLDNVWFNDGITTGALSLGTLVPNRTYTLRFEGTLNNAYNGTLTNTVNVHVDGLADQTRTSTVSVVGWYTPTPTVTPVYTNTSITEFGRNVSRGQSGEYAAVVARGSETIDVIVRVHANSSSTLHNVILTNILPSGLNYIARSTTVDGISAADGITTSGLNIGSLMPNQGVVVKFSVLVDPNSVPIWGQVDLRNTTQVRADNLSTISAQLPITLGNSVSIAAISRVKTGPADSILLALLISALVTAMYALYTRTALFGRRLALSEIRQSMVAKSTPNFLR